MEERMVYLTNPANIVSLVIFIFTLGVTWSKLDWKIKDCEKRIEKIEDLDLDSRLTEIQTNIHWIMEKLKEK